KTEQAKNYGTAIVAGRADRYERNYGNRVYNNEVTGFSTGITMTNTDLEVYNNSIIDCKRGISVNTISNSKIYGNHIKSVRESSDGIVSHPTTEYMDGLVVGSDIGENNNPKKT